MSQETKTVEIPVSELPDAAATHQAVRELHEQFARGSDERVNALGTFASELTLKSGVSLEDRALDILTSNSEQNAASTDRQSTLDAIGRAPRGDKLVVSVKDDGEVAGVAYKTDLGTESNASETAKRRLQNRLPSGPVNNTIRIGGAHAQKPRYSK